MQKSPDGGTSRFWYDRLGRLAISQNANQRAAGSPDDQDKLYSYTQYDRLGRITEVGQMKNTAANGAMTNALSRDTTLLKDWLLALTNRREQITQTIYDLPYPGFEGSPDPRLVLEQRNVRNRVSYVSYTDHSNPSAYNNATFYSYDILGNVDTLLQDYGCDNCGLPLVYNMMNKNKNRYKKIVYQYDLVSGKVNMVQYQPGFIDTWIHRYSYDAENRLTLVETSNDSLVWEKDARYEYYRHGPLARTVLGDQLVQGIDYAYTLQGWLKGMNSASYLHDMGGDSKAGTVNKYVARDAVGFSLNYFNGEYKPIGTNVVPFPGYRGEAGAALPNEEYRPLYNGNISSALYNMRKFELNGHVPAFYNYKYDQLNRYKGQDGYFNYNAGTSSYGDFTPVNTYKERVSYDANGNIQDYVRYNIHPQGTPMDELSYKYYPGTNKLRQVTDQVPAWQFGTNVWDVPDIDNQDSLNNYKYDSIGNLVRDESEKNMAIKWNVYGKITEITRNANIADNNTTFRLRYSYDAAGNRIGKERKWYNKDNNRYEISYTWYVRDAQGNLISTYVANTPDTSGANLQDLFVEFTDQQIYGSSRLGSYSVKTNVDDGPIDRYVYTGYAAKFDRGYRQYELSNHLGNVLTTISDKKIGVSSGPVGSLIDYYEPDMVNAQDYFPFGMVSRFNAGNSDQQYRFGFNGKENDNEVKGFANQQDYGARVYDSRLGRFLSVDPAYQDYVSLSPYAFAADNPIRFIDVYGEGPGDPPIVKTNVGHINITKNLRTYTFEEMLKEAKVRLPDPFKRSFGEKVWSVGKFLRKAALTALLVITPVPNSPACCTSDRCGSNSAFSCNWRKLNDIQNGKGHLEIYTTDPSLLPDWYLQEVKGRLMDGTADVNDWQYKDELVERGYVTDKFGKPQVHNGNPNSETLSNNLFKAGFIRQIDQAAHHIVAGKAKLAEKAKRILKREKIDINDADNGVFLETSKHNPLHKVDCYRKINDRLRNAQPGKVREELNEIAKELFDGKL